MSQHLDIVRAFYAFSGERANLVESFSDEEYVANGKAAFAHLADPAFEFVLIEGEVGEAVYPGVEGFWTGMREWLSSWESYGVRADDILEVSDDVVVVLTVEEGRSTSGVPLTQRGAVVYRFRGGRLLRIVTYLRREAGLASVGLTERKVSSG